ncbi:MAG: S9 family peptidase [Bacteroidota bacterium]
MRFPFLMASILGLASGLVAQTLRPLELEDMFLMKRVSAPVLSPDGKSVVYNLSTPDLQANIVFTDLWMSPVLGGPARRLTSRPAYDGDAAWSPDGRWIAFESTGSGKGQIWLMSADGKEMKQFTTLSTGATKAVWSPDGKSIAYVSEVFPEFSHRPFRESDSLNRTRLEELEQGKVEARILTRLLYRHWDKWVEGKRKHIFIQPLNGGEPRNLTPGDRDAVPTSETFSGGIDFAFSPDGKEIAYTATPVPIREEAWSTNHDIYIVPASGGTPRQFTTNPAADGTPRYSPDGRYIAYRAQKRRGFEADRWEIMLYDRAAGTARSITSSFDAHARTPVWSPDSRMIYFEAEDEGIEPIFAVSVPGGEVRTVLAKHTSHNINVTRDGKMLVFTNVSAVRPAEVFRCYTDGSGFLPVSGANDSLFARLNVPPQEPLWFDGAGGVKVHSWIFFPPGFDRTRKYPLVYLVHGGPQNAWLDSWSFRWCPSLWAAQGYIIVAPNPRGSTGFGQKFTDEISRDWGGKVFEDLMQGLDYIETLPYIDTSRVAAAGASFGGYMMNWFLGNAPNRFKAIITHDGVYNFVSNYGTTDEVWFDEWDHGGTPWGKPEEFERYSPHRFAANFKTPTLIIHGALDYRVPESEAMQLFTALQRQGVPSKFLYFPDEGHWVSKPANSELWHRTVFDWLKQYIGK